MVAPQQKAAGARKADKSGPEIIVAPDVDGQFQSVLARFGGRLGFAGSGKNSEYASRLLVTGTSGWGQDIRDNQLVSLDEFNSYEVRDAAQWIEDLRVRYQVRPDLHPYILLPWSFYSAVMRELETKSEGRRVISFTIKFEADAELGFKVVDIEFDNSPQEARR
jgi:hypothetical protein